MNRRNLFLTGILILQLLIGTVVFWPRHAASGKEGASLFPGVEAERIAKLTIRDGQGKSIVLAKNDQKWVLPEADDYPCQQDKVSSLVAKIVGLKANRLVTQTTTSHKRLKVAEGEYERLIEFVMDDGVLHRLYVGTSPAYLTTHVRADGHKEVYLTSDLSAQDATTDAQSWVDRAYLSVPQDQIVAITLENANGRFEFKKQGETWTMADLAPDETLKEGTVKSLAGRVATITLLQPLGKGKKASYGMDQPSAVITFQTHSDEAGDKTYTLWVGARDPVDNHYIVKSSESEYYVKVSQYTLNELVEKKRDSFLELPPTPTPTPTPESLPEATPEG